LEDLITLEILRRGYWRSLMTSELYRKLYRIALEEFGDIVVEAKIISLPSEIPVKLGLNLLNDSFADVWIPKRV